MAKRPREEEDFDEIERKGRNKDGKVRRGQKDPEAININLELEAQVGREQRELEDQLRRVGEVQGQVGDEAAAFAAETQELLPDGVTETQEAQFEMIDERALAAAAQAQEALDVIKQEQFLELFKEDIRKRIDKTGVVHMQADTSDEKVFFRRARKVAAEKIGINLENVDSLVSADELLEAINEVMREYQPITPESSLPDAKREKFLKHFEKQLDKELDDLEFLSEEDIAEAYESAKIAAQKKLKLDTLVVDDELNVEMKGIERRYSERKAQRELEITENKGLAVNVLGAGKNREILERLKDKIGDATEPESVADTKRTAPKKEAAIQGPQAASKTGLQRVQKVDTNSPKRIDIDEYVRQGLGFAHGTVSTKGGKESGVTFHGRKRAATTSAPETELETAPTSEQLALAAEIDAKIEILDDLVTEIYELPNEHHFSDSALTALDSFVDTYDSSIQKLAELCYLIKSPQDLVNWNDGHAFIERKLRLAKEYLLSLDSNAVITKEDIENHVRQQPEVVDVPAPSIGDRFEQLFRKRLQRELRLLDSQTSAQGIEGAYKHVLDAVFDQVNSSYDDRGRLQEQNNITRDEAVVIARAVRAELEAAWRNHHDEFSQGLERLENLKVEAQKLDGGIAEDLKPANLESTPAIEMLQRRIERLFAELDTATQSPDVLKLNEEFQAAQKRSPNTPEEQQQLVDHLKHIVSRLQDTVFGRALDREQRIHASEVKNQFEDQVQYAAFIEKQLREPETSSPEFKKIIKKKNDILNKFANAKENDRLEELLHQFKQRVVAPLGELFHERKSPEAVIVENQTELPPVESLENDPRFQQIIEAESLSYLKTTDSAWFYRNFSGEVSPAGYLIDRQGKETNLLPSQNITSGWDAVKAKSEKVFAERYPTAAQAPEKPPQDPNPKKPDTFDGLSEAPTIQYAGMAQGVEVGPDNEDSLEAYGRLQQATVKVEAPKPAAEQPEVEKGQEHPSKLFLIDTSEVVRAYARREAEQKLEQLRHSSNTLQRTWLRLGEKGYLSKFYKESLANISTNKNLLAEIEARFGRSENRNEGREYSDEILNSLIEEFDQAVVETDEVGDFVQDAEVSAALGDLCRRYAIDDPAIHDRHTFDAAVDEVIIPILLRKGFAFSNDANRAGQADGLMFASNLFKFAESYKAGVKNQLEALQEQYPDDAEKIKAELSAEMALDIQLGLKQRDLYETKPAGALSWYEKLVDRLESVPILNKVIANPMMYGAVAGGLTAAATIGTRGIARAGAVAGVAAIAGTAGMIAPLVVGAGVGGAFIAARRGRDLKYDRGMDLRRRTLGAESGGARTDTMRKFAYDQKDATTVTEQLRSLLAQDQLNEDDRLAVADSMARLALEKEKSLDLFSVDAEQGGQYKTRALAMKDLKVALKQLQEKFDLSDESFTQLQTETAATLVEGIEGNDRDFNRYKRQQMVKSGVFGVAMGLALGTVGQYGVYQGLEAAGIKTPDSALEKIYQVLRGDQAATAPAENMQQVLEQLQIKKLDTGDVQLVSPKGEVLADHLRFGDNGELTPESQQALLDKHIDFSAHRTSEVVSQAPNTYFGEELQKHGRGAWHDEVGKKMSSFFNKLIEYEGKQQMLYLDKNADGSVIVNAQAILQNLEKNLNGSFKQFGTSPDGSVDSKLASLLDQLRQYQKEGTLAEHLKVQIIPTDEANKQGLGILTAGANAEGKISLPEKVARLFTDKTSLTYGHHPVKFIELRLDDHVLATSVGADMSAMPGMVDHYQYDFSTAAVAPVSEVSPATWDLPPVLPFDSRKALEKSAVNDRIVGGSYYQGHYELSPVELEKYQDQRLPLLETPDTILNPQKAAEMYLSKQDEHYHHDLEVLVKDLEPRHPDCKVAVCIPVAGHQESHNIYKTLESYSHQSADPKSFEIVLFVNHPEKDLQGNKLDAKKTIKEIERFKKDHPELKVQYIYKALKREDAVIGNIRKILSDTVLLREQSAPNERDLILVSNDADNEGLSPKYIENFINKFEAHPEVDSFMGRLDWDPKAYVRNPVLHVGTRLFQYIAMQSRHKGWHIESSGANFAYRASIYAAVGGYDQKSPLAEDVDLGRKIKAARMGATRMKDVGVAGSQSSRLYTSARRAEKAFTEGKAPIEQWETGFSAYDDEIRKGKWQINGEVNWDDPEELKKFKSDIEKVVNQTINLYLGIGGRYGELAGKALKWLGIKYELGDKGQVKVTDITLLIDGLKKYQREGLKLYEQKIGKEPKMTSPISNNLLRRLKWKLN